jgi:hypothetical protein
MRLFICWSGEKSKTVAEAFHRWIPYVLPDVKPFLSSADIPKGGTWSHHVEDQLRETQAGLVCLTSENLTAPWLHFEAGALSKMSDALVCTYLLDVAEADIRGPLSRFQHTTATREETFQLIQSLNKNLGPDKLADSYIGGQFEKWWSDLEQDLRRAKTLGPPATNPTRSTDDLLEELIKQHRDTLTVENLSTAVDNAVQRALTSPALVDRLRSALQPLSHSDELLVRELLKKALGDPRWNWRTPSAIAAESGVSEDEALRILRRMAAEGEIRFSPSEKYKLVVGLTGRT